MKTDSGFTLLEILVVVLIITILATIVGVNVIPGLGKANVAAATAQIREFKTALKLYRMDNGSVPTQQQGLSALCRKPDIPPLPVKYPDEGYIDGRSVPLDPWGREYIYLSPAADGSAFEVVTYGSDGEPGGDGTAADISSMGL
jgi:general secretion pathway protein G